MKPINFRDLVYNIIEKEYNRLKISPLNEVIVSNLSFEVFGAKTGEIKLEDIKKILEEQLYGLIPFDEYSKFNYNRVCSEIMYSRKYATCCEAEE